MRILKESEKVWDTNWNVSTLEVSKEFLSFEKILKVLCSVLRVTEDASALHVWRNLEKVFSNNLKLPWSVENPSKAVLREVSTNFKGVSESINGF